MDTHTKSLNKLRWLKPCKNLSYEGSHRVGSLGQSDNLGDLIRPSVHSFEVEGRGSAGDCSNERKYGEKSE